MSRWESDPNVADRAPVRAAQYVRMSTEHQKYSTENQADIIQAYAERRGFEIVRTYADQGKSGLRIDVFERPMIAKRASGRRENEASDFLARTPVKALVNGVVLAVDRQNRHAALACSIGDKPTRRDQHLLVGQRDCLAALNGREYRFEARRTRRRTDHDVDGRVRSHRNKSGRPGAKHRRRGRATQRPELVYPLSGCHGCYNRTVSRDLLCEERCVVARCKRHDLEPLRMGIDHGQCAAPDRPGRAKNGDVLHDQTCRYT